MAAHRALHRIDIICSCGHSATLVLMTPLGNQVPQEGTKAHEKLERAKKQPCYTCRMKGNLAI